MTGDNDGFFDAKVEEGATDEQIIFGYTKEVPDYI